MFRMGKSIGKKQRNGCLGLWGKQMGSGSSKWYEFSFGGNENVVTLIVGMFPGSLDILKATELYTIWANCMVYELYLSTTL